MNRGVSFAVVALLVVAAFAAGWMLNRPPKDSERPDAELTAADASQLRGEVAALKSEVATLRTANEKAEETIARFEEEHGESGAPAIDPADVPVRGPVAEILSYQGIEEALASVDWKSSGESVAHLAPLLVLLMDAIRSGGPMPPELGQIQRWNGPLVTEALKLENAGVPGTGINGSFTNPGVTANLVLAALMQAGLPLTDPQRRELDALTRRSLIEDHRRRAAYPEDTIQLRKVMDETALKDRYYEDLRAILTEEQEAILHPEAARGRLQIDLLCSGVVWLQFARPVFFTNREDLEASILRVSNENLSLDEADRPVLAQLAKEWATSFSDEYLALPTDPLDRRMMVEVSRVRQAAEAELAVIERLLSALPADSAAAIRLRNEAMVLVPLRNE